MLIKATHFLFALILLSATVTAQGKFAGTHKNIIGKKFTDEKANPWTKGYKWRQGDLITDQNDGRPQFLHIYFKGKEALVIYAAQVDGPATLFIIIDAIEVKGLATGWDVWTAGCAEGDTEGQIITAVVKPGNKTTATLVQKAWRVNRDKLRIETMDAKAVHCMVEDGD